MNQANINTFKIKKYQEKSVLCIEGHFSCTTTTLRIKGIINNQSFAMNALILPTQQGKGEVDHLFEIEWESNEEIRTIELYLCEDDKEELMWKCEDVTSFEEESSIISKIAQVVYQENQTGVIYGWAYSSMGSVVNYKVVDENQNEVPSSLRRVVQQRMMERNVVSKEQGLCGFQLTFKVDGEHQYSLVLEDGYTTETISLDSYVQQNKMTFERIKHLFSLINMRTVQRAMVYLQKNGLLSFFKRLTQGITPEMDYDAYYKRNKVTKEELEKQRKHVFAYQPKISILVPTFNTPVSLLNEMITSVVNQSYENWELCIADGSAKGNDTQKALIDWQTKDHRIKVTFLSKNYGISGNTNKAFDRATGEYTALFDHDDLLELDTLYEIVKSLQDTHHDIIYTDEDKYNQKLERFEDPNFKPDFDLDLLLSHNYITHFFTVKTSILKEVGGFRSECDGAQDYDVILRCVAKSKSIHHIPKSLYHWRMIEGSTALDPESKMYCYEAGQKAIQDYLDSRDIKAVVEMQPKPLYGLYHVKYAVPDSLVSIIIPNKDHVDVLDTCIQSLYTKNQYKYFEIIVVENNSEEEKTFAYYEKIQQEHSNLKVVTYDQKGFNFSAINNFGVRFALGEYLLFLNNDTEMIKEDALSEMVSLCAREDVGIVGAKLLFEDNTIQHAGVIVGFSGYAGHIFNDIPNGKDFGYMTRDVLNGDYSAVTAACMMTKKKLFKAVGGFDEQFAIACNDIDYCLKVREVGKLVVYNAFSLWHHYESKSRGYEDGFDKVKRFDDEVSKWQKKWERILIDGDPYYNPNFKIEDGPFILP